MNARILSVLRTFAVLSLTLFFSFFTLNGAAQSTQDETQYIYVCNQGEATLSVIDTESHEVTEVIDLQELGFSENAKPHHAIAEPDGSHWYVTLIGENRVLKFNRQNELVDEATLEVPGLMALNIQNDELYVGRSMSAVNPPSSFGVLQRSDMSIKREVDLFFSRPHAIAITPVTNWMYIASLSANQILSMNTESEESNLTVLDGNNNVFVNFAIAPDGKTMVGTGQVTGKLLVFDIADAANPVVTDTIDVDSQPWHPVYSPDGRYVYFGNKGAHTVTVVDMQSRTVVAVIEGEGLAQPHGAALSADGAYLYVTNNNLDGTYRPADNNADELPGTVTVIDTKTHEIIKVIETGRYPTGIGTNAQ